LAFDRTKIFEPDTAMHDVFKAFTTLLTNHFHNSLMYEESYEKLTIKEIPIN